VIEPQRPRRPGSVHAVLLAAAVLAASAAGGFLFYRLTAPERTTLYAAHAVSGAAAPDAPPAPAAPPPTPASAPAAPTIPERLPEITLPGPDGAPHTLADWKGRPLLINFWATWCEPCRREIPLLRSLRHERSRQGLEVVGIAIDDSDAVRKYIPSHGIDYPVLVGEQGGFAAISAFGMDTVLPFSVFADRAGRVITLKVGELHRQEAELILDRVREVDAGTLSLAAAREQISAGMQRLSAARPMP
jgi:thiol-disulfide isomerase/thioredoxin